jgi:hypothetical protein
MSLKMDLAPILYGDGRHEDCERPRSGVDLSGGGAFMECGTCPSPVAVSLVWASCYTEATVNFAPMEIVL